MEGQDYTYVNGEGDYRGNILLDPQGTPTRAEMYDAIAEASRPVEVTVTAEVGPAEIAFWVAVSLCLLAIVGWLSRICGRMP